MENVAKNGGQWPLYGPTGQQSEKNLKNDGESGCGWLY